MDRVSWDEYFLQMTELVANRSTCIRRKVGAVAVKDKRVLATGYNGVPSGMEHCKTKGCLREELKIPSGQRHEICRAVHAEQNVICQAATHGISLEGCTIYLTTHPCIICAKLLISCKVERIVYSGKYPDEMSSEFLKEAGILIERIEYDLLRTTILKELRNRNLQSIGRSL